MNGLDNKMNCKS